MNITTASVKVMRSHDYCHFEVALTATLEPADLITKEAAVIAQIDELRKTANRLADKAVKQYRQRKRALQIATDYATCDLREKVLEIEKKAETDRSPEEQATVKEYKDRCHAARFDYQDDWSHPDDEDEDGDGDGN